MKLTAEGPLVDEETLKEKYKDRPDQLAAIKRNVKKQWCKAREAVTSRREGFDAS